MSFILVTHALCADKTHVLAVQTIAHWQDFVQDDIPCARGFVWMNISVDTNMMNSHLPAVLEINVKHFSFQFPHVPAHKSFNPRSRGHKYLVFTLISLHSSVRGLLNTEPVKIYISEELVLINLRHWTHLSFTDLVSHYLSRTTEKLCAKSQSRKHCFA